MLQNQQTIAMHSLDTIIRPLRKDESTHLGCSDIWCCLVDCATDTMFQSLKINLLAINYRSCAVYENHFEIDKRSTG